MRRRRLRIGAGILLVLLAHAATAWWLIDLRPAIRPRTWSRIEHGMPLAQVEAIIGAPPGQYGGDEPSAYIATNLLRHQKNPQCVLVADVFKRSPEWPAVEQQDVAAKLSEGRIVVWTSPDFAIAVQTDADNCVVASCLGAIRPADAAAEMGPTWWQRLLQAVGIE